MALPCAALTLAVVASAASAAAAPPAATVWPRPRFLHGGGALARVAPGSNFFSSVRDSAFLLQAFERYVPLVFPHAGSGLVGEGRAAITGLTFTVHDLSDGYPQLDTDESYALTIPPGGGSASASSRTVYGALRALETFSQLVAFDFENATYTIQAPLQIKDAPRFPHRGLMVDTGRHFLPLTSLRAIIDSLPYAKLNVLHWHMVDMQSFPFQSISSPKLWDGAYSFSERYTQGDVASVVEYARLRGVRVVVEFDTPGHAQSWCVGYPELCPSSNCSMPLNVASNRTFGVIEGLLDEITGGRRSSPGKPSGIFPDDFIHLGGDEVDTSCWSQTPEVEAWLKAERMSPDDAYEYFVRRVAAAAIQRGRRPIQWSEVFDHFRDHLPKEVIVHVWKDITNVTEVVAYGYNVLRNVGYNNFSWYLDNLDVRWDAIYRNDPCEDIPEGELCDRVLGGHGEMWGETVDASNLQQTVWPRLAAIAEKLWSPRAETQDLESATLRIHAFRCILLERGVAAAPVDNKAARSAAAGPGSNCYNGRTLATGKSKAIAFV